MTSKRKPFQFGLNSLFRTVAVVAALMLVAKVGRGSIFAGPFLWVKAHPMDLGAWLTLVVLVIAIASFPIRPNIVTGVVAALSVLGWLFMGIIAFDL